MKRKPVLTKRERKATRPAGAARPAPSNNAHIHCVGCGKHLDPADFETPAVATILTCDHGSQFASCVVCMPKSIALVKEHDATNQPVRSASAWH
jgi:hypothetical protein